MKDKDQKNALNEIRLLASIKNQNIIGYKEAFFDNESKTLNMVLELALQGDLQVLAEVILDSNQAENLEKAGF